MKSILLVALLMAAGCQKDSQGRQIHTYQEICVNNVVYYVSHNRMAVKLDTESKVEVCK